MTTKKIIGRAALALVAASVLLVFAVSFLPVKFVVLWTDALIFILCAMCMGFAAYASQHEHLRVPWREVARDRVGVVAVVFLSAYLVIGLLDSVHFRMPLPDVKQSTEQQYSNDVLSVLDWMATPVREGVEKSYSAPFAAHLYVKETVDLPDGSKVRLHPRLQHGGAHLNNPEQERSGDILNTSLLSVIEGVVVWTVFTALLILWLARRHHRPVSEMFGLVMRGRSEIPWHVILFTTAILILLTILVVNLSGKYHIFGTDKVGQDTFYQTLKSIRTGLVIGTLTTLIMLPFAILAGIAAGYFRGLADDIIQYVYTTLSSIPGVLLIAAAILMLQVYMATHPDLFETAAARADLRLLFLCIILGVTSWTGLCRLLRGEAMKLREMDYIQAAVAFGVGHFKIIGRHILPNVMHIVLISIVLDFSALVLAEAVLSYVGVGVDPTMNSWGNMINSARMEMAREPIVWWPLLAAFIFMFVLVLSANLFADAVRDAFDPRLRRSGLLRMTLSK